MRPTRAPVRSERYREVHGDSGLPDAALSAGHGDHMAQVRVRHGRRRRWPRGGSRLLIHDRQRAARANRCVSHRPSRVAVPDSFAVVGRVGSHFPDLRDSQLQVRRDALHQRGYGHLAVRTATTSAAESPARCVDRTTPGRSSEDRSAAVAAAVAKSLRECVPRQRPLLPGLMDFES